MKKLFFGLLVLLAICSCENREASQEIDEPVIEKLTIEKDNVQSRDSIPTQGIDPGIGPVVTIPPR